MHYALGIVGRHLESSLSPRLHTAALRSLGLAGEYRRFEVEPGGSAVDEIERLVARLRSGELTGLNVTIPLKEVALLCVDGLTDEARAVGAVNTLYRSHRSVIGDNTDAKGFLTDFHSQAQRAGESALILGAGGAARAVAYALATDGWRVLVASRRPAQAQALAADLGRAIARPIEPLAFDPISLGQALEGIGLLVNATPVGSAWSEGDSPWPAGMDLPPHATVYDLVYLPWETALMRTARLAGLPTVGGIGMLVEQAALAFELWTGSPAPRQSMMEAALGDPLRLQLED